MIDFTEITHTDDTWELFARDFLIELGFYIESTPDRGPDGGKDILISENLEGTLGKYRFKWLVSCKHYAKSGKSVRESDEPNILERVKSFGAQGFLGFYSTLPSSGLNSRLTDLKKNYNLKDYRIFDGKLIENYLIRIGYSRVMMRYLPEAYKAIKPLHKLFKAYLPIKCDVCEKDLLEALYREERNAIVAQASSRNEEGIETVEHMYFACKGECDDQLNRMIFKNYELVTGWNDITDLAIPINYLRYLIATLNRFNHGKYRYTKEALEKEKYLLMALAQKVFREMTEAERERVATLMQCEMI